MARRLHGSLGTKTPLRNIAPAFAAVLLFATLASTAWAEAFRQAPNSRIALEVGTSFSASNRFPGFLDEKSGASFVIAEMPGAAYDEVKKLADQPVALAQNGIEDTQKGELRGRQGEYVYVIGKQRAGSSVFVKFLLIMRQSGVTGMITVNVPQEAFDAHMITREQIERTLTTAKIAPVTAVKEEPFQLGYLGPFKEAINGPSKVYNLTGRPPEGLTNAPIFIISTDQSDSPNVKLAAQQAFKIIGGFKNHIAELGKDVTISGLRGHAITGHAFTIKTEAKTGIYYVMLPGKDGNYYIIIGTSPETEMTTYLPEFQKMAASLKIKE